MLIVAKNMVYSQCLPHDRSLTAKANSADFQDSSLQGERMSKEKGRVEIDLTGINVDEIAVFLQDGARGVPEMSASCACFCSPPGASSSCYSCGNCVQPPGTTISDNETPEKRSK